MTNWIRKLFAALCALTLLISCAFASGIENTEIPTIEAEDFIPEETAEIQENAGEEEQSADPADEQPAEEEATDEKLADEEPTDVAQESTGTEVVVSEVKTLSDEIGQPENLPQGEEPAEQEPAEEVQPQETKSAEQEPAEEDQPQETEPAEQESAEEVQPQEEEPTEQEPAEEDLPLEGEPAEQEPAEEVQPQESEPAEQESSEEDLPQEAEPAEDTAPADEKTDPAPESEPEEERILSLAEGAPKSIKGKVSPENPCIVKATDDFSRTVLFTLTVSAEDSVSVTLNNQIISLTRADTEDEIRYTFTQKLNKDQITDFTLTANGDAGVFFTLTISRMPYGFKRSTRVSNCSSVSANCKVMVLIETSIMGAFINLAIVMISVRCLAGQFTLISASSRLINSS